MVNLETDKYGWMVDQCAAGFGHRKWFFDEINKYLSNKETKERIKACLEEDLKGIEIDVFLDYNKTFSLLNDPDAKTRNFLILAANNLLE